MGGRWGRLDPPQAQCGRLAAGPIERPVGREVSSSGVDEHVLEFAVPVDGLET